MRYLLLIVFFYCSISISLRAQHTMTIAPEDSICLKVNEWRGDLQWQVSYDNAAWNDLSGETKDSLKYVPRQFPSYFRVKITEGTCAPHYSDTTEVVLIAGLPTVVTTSIDFSAIGVTNAVIKGNVTNVGASFVTSKGIVYSTSPHPNLYNASKTTNGTGSGSITALLTGLSDLTTYYVRAYATNSQGTSYGEEYSFSTRTSVIYSIGDVGPAGGIVYYDKGSYSDGWRYLELSPEEWSGGYDPWDDIDWGCDGILIDQTSLEIGTGKENTDRILANGCIQENNIPDMVASAEINGFTDWFLPSRKELEAVYDNLYPLESDEFHNAYGLRTVTYASSSEIDADRVWGIDMAAGGDIIAGKDVDLAVRPIRRF